jgi:hypothetical protein
LGWCEATILTRVEQARSGGRTGPLMRFVF